MRALIWILAIFAIAAGVAMLAGANEGYVLIVSPPWRAQVSLNLVIVVLLLSFFVSYALIRAGLLDSPMPSEGFRKFGRRGDGDWVTVYARAGHTFLTVGGLRFDTGFRGEGRGPTWTTRPRPTRGYVVRHPPGL